MKYFAFLILYFVLGHNTFAQDFTHTPTGIIFPEKLGEMKMEESRDYEEVRKGLGAGMRYRHLISADVIGSLFIYNLGKDKITEGMGADVQEAFNAADKEVKQVAEKQKYEKLKKKISTKTLSDKSNSKKGYYAEYTYKYKGEQYKSYLFMIGVKNHFFKIRYTFLKDNEGIADTAFKNMLAQLETIL